MKAAVLREQLHTFIELADIEKVKALHAILATDMEEILSAYDLTDEQLKEVRKRRKEYLSGKTEAFSWDSIKANLK